MELEKIKNQMEKLTERQQVLLYKKCIHKIKNKTVNKNGVFFDLSSVAYENLKDIIDFLKQQGF